MRLLWTVVAIVIAAGMLISLATAPSVLMWAELRDWWRQRQWRKEQQP